MIYNVTADETVYIVGISIYWYSTEKDILTIVNHSGQARCPSLRVVPNMFEDILFFVPKMVELTTFNG